MPKDNLPPPPPNAATTALRASLFAANIASWLPPGFASSSTSPESDLASLLHAGDEGNYGVGHPALNAPKSIGRQSLVGLQKRLKRESRAKDGGAEPSSPKIESESEDEDSRAKIVARGKRKARSGLLSRPQIKPESSRPSMEPAVTQGARLPNGDAHDGEHRNDEEEPRTPEPLTTTSSPGGAGTFPFSGPLALDSPKAQRMLAAHATGSTEPDTDETRFEGLLTASIMPRAEDDEGSERKSEPSMSKTQARRAKRKRARQAKVTQV